MPISDLPPRSRPRDSAPPDDAIVARRNALSAALLATGLEDRRAFRRVYDLTSAKLFGICLRICGERRAAEDVLQEVYLTIWRRAGSYEPTRASPITWLATIARNRSIDWRRVNRKLSPDLPPGAGSQAPLEEVDTSPSADRLMIATEDAARLKFCLEALDERPRAAIRSAFLDGLTYAELARKADVPLSTMKSTVRRSLLRLRECLDDDA